MHNRNRNDFQPNPRVGGGGIATNNVNQAVANSAIKKSAVGESKRLKVQFIQSNVNCNL
jgi:hypothetical protein